MLRRLITTTALASIVLIGPPQPSSMRDTYAEAIRIDAVPVTLASDDAARRRVGNLTLIAGWKLTSRSPQFGGWSTLAVEGDRVTAIGDAGSVLRFRLTRFGLATGARIDPLPKGCGRTDDKRYRDTESATHLAGGDWLIGFEWRNAFCRVSPDFRAARGTVAPPVMSGWPRSYGPESLLALADGRVVTIAERSRGGGARPVLVFPRDPVTGGTTPIARYTYAPPEGFDPTDLAALPDGRWLILNRRLMPGELFTTKLTLVDARGAPTGAALTGRVLAHFARPVLHDNFEGLSVTIEDERPLVWMISDDNFFAWQGTYLLKLAIDPAALRPLPAPPPPGPSRPSASTAAP